MSDSSYDTVPYSSKPDRGRHIDRLASIAHLVGISSKNIHQARVLEIGCGTGKNLIAMAELLPKAEFVGIEPSEEEHSIAKETVESLGIENVTLLNESIENFHSEKSFDYIICHGVFSWVSKTIQAEILRKIKALLSDAGLAMVSYNSYPGWHLRQSIRDLLLSFDIKEEPAVERIKKARETLKSVQAAVLFDHDRPFSVLLHQEIERIAREPDAYLLHEFLANENHAYYYKDFCEAVKTHRLIAIGDARFFRMSINRLFQGDVASAAFKKILQLGTEVNSIEHVMDHLWFNVFRESILCHDTHTPTADIELEQIRTLSFCGFLNYDADAKEFKDIKGITLKISHPLLEKTLHILTKNYPTFVSYPQLLLLAQQAINDRERDTSRDEDLLAGALLEWMQRDIIDFSLHPPTCNDRVLAHPKTTPFIRKQAQESNVVVNLFHNSIDIGPLEQELLKLLDGVTDREVMAKHAYALISKGEGGIREDGVEITDPEKQKELLNGLVSETLETLRRAGLLVA